MRPADKIEPRSRSSRALVLVVGTLFGGAACGDSVPAEKPGTATDDAGSPAVSPCVETPTDPKCVDDTSALFVSKTGTSGGEGTRANPVNTVGIALQKIDAKRRRIYICEGTYEEDVAFNSAQNGVSLIGGVDCSWNAKAGAKPVLGGSANPMKAVGVSGLALVDIAVEAKDATNGGSSIALFVSGGDVTLKGVRLVAGNGGNGANGKLEEFKNFPTQTDLNGNDGTAAGGGPEKPVTCPDGAKTVGGKGGNAGDPGQPGLPTLDGGAGGTVGACETSGLGGSKGSPGLPAGIAASASVVGALTAAGWTPEPGANGKPGGPGQGGGGGGGFGGTGGSGGAGGCGGAGGGGGSGGGASVAIAAFTARVKLAASSARTQSGGAGGNGAEGQMGQAIFGLRGVGTGNACNGGSGGIGGKGGAGGGGAGGVSVGLLTKGGSLDIDDATKAAIQLGSPGPGGKDGTGAATNVGKTGANDPILAL